MRQLDMQAARCIELPRPFTGNEVNGVTKEDGMRRRFASATVLGFTVVISACTITFDGVNGTGNPILTTLTVTEQGQTAVFTSGHFHAIGSPNICLFGGCIDNGTVYIQEEAGGLGQPINMAMSNGSTLTLFNFQVAQPYNDDAAAAAGGFPNATTVRVVGNLATGGTVVTTCPIPTTGFGQCTVPGTFTNLRSVTFSGLTAAGGPGGISIDNISYLPGGGPTTTTSFDSDGAVSVTSAAIEAGVSDPSSGK